MNIITENQNDVNFYFDTESSPINNENVNKTITDALTVKIEAETDEYCGAGRHERNPKRKDYRNGSSQRVLNLPIFGKIVLKLPHTRKGGIKSQTYFELVNLVKFLRAKIIITLYALGISVRDICFALNILGFKRIEKSRVDEIIIEIANRMMKAFYSRGFSNTYCPIIYVDSLYDPIRYNSHYTKMAIMVVYGISMQGIPVFLGLLIAPGESAKPYIELFEDLKSRGLGCPKIVVSDGNLGIQKAVSTCFPGCIRQLCFVHHIRNAMGKLPNDISNADKSRFGKDMAAVFNEPTKEEAIGKAKEFIEEYRDRYPEAVNLFERSYIECLSFYDLPEIDSKFIRSSNLIERQNSEFRRRLDKVHGFPNMDACKRLILVSRISRPWFSQVLIPKEQLKKAVKSRNRILGKLEERLNKITEAFQKSFKEEVGSLLYSRKIFGIHLVYEPGIFYKNNGGMLIGFLFAYGITDKGRRFPFAFIPVISSQLNAVGKFLETISQFSLTEVGYICHNLTESQAVETLRAGLPKFQEIYSRDDLKEEIQDWMPEEFQEESGRLISALFKVNDQSTFLKKLSDYIEIFQDKCPEAVRILTEHTDSYEQLLDLLEANVSFSRCVSLKAPRTVLHLATRKADNGYHELKENPDLIDYFYQVQDSLLKFCIEEVPKQAYLNRQAVQSVLAR